MNLLYPLQASTTPPSETISIADNFLSLSLSNEPRAAALTDADVGRQQLAQFDGSNFTSIKSHGVIHNYFASADKSGTNISETRYFPEK